MPTLTPTFAPYVLVSARFGFSFPEFEKKEDFSHVAESLFRNTLVHVLPSLRPAQIMDIVASTPARSGNDGGTSRRHLRAHSSGVQGGATAATTTARQTLVGVPSGVNVTFMAEVGAGEFSSITGREFIIEGPASDDAWSQSNESLAIARDLALDLRDGIAATLNPIHSTRGTYSAWAAGVVEVLSSMPNPNKNAELQVLLGSPDPQGVVLDINSVSVKVCSWAKPCFAPSPLPTIPAPSLVPTPTPSMYSEYESDTIFISSAAFALLVVVQALVCYGLAFRHAKKAKRAMESGRSVLGPNFTRSHIIDLFGADGLFGRQAVFPRDKQKAASATQPSEFSSTSVKAMFVALDSDRDGFVTQRDIDIWVESQKVALIHGDTIRAHEIDALLRQGRPTVSALEADAPFSASARKLLKRLRERSFRKRVVGSLGSTLIGSSTCPDNEPRLTEERLNECLARFSKLAFDWEDPLGFGNRANSSSPFTTSARGCYHAALTREKASSIFRRLDTDGDGWVHPSDLRVWRRMLPLGRSADALVRALFVEAKKATAAAFQPLSRGKRGQRGRRGDVIGGAAVLPHLLKPSAEKRAVSATFWKDAEARFGMKSRAQRSKDQEQLRIKPLNFWMALRDDPLLGAELIVQESLLEFMMSEDSCLTPEEEEEAVGGGISSPLHSRGKLVEKPMNILSPKQQVSADEDPFDHFEGESDEEDPFELIAQMGYLRDIDNLAVAVTEESDVKEDCHSPRTVCTSRKKHTTNAQFDVGVSSQGTGALRKPNDVAISAFVCVAKIKLLRLSQSMHEIKTREDTVAGEVFCAIVRHSAFHRRTQGMAESPNFVTTQDIQLFLQHRAGLVVGVAKEDLDLIFGTDTIGEEEATGSNGERNHTHFESSSPLTALTTLGSLPSNGMDRLALRHKLGHPSRRAMADLLHTFVVLDAINDFTAAAAAERGGDVVGGSFSADDVAEGGNNLGWQHRHLPVMLAPPPMGALELQELFKAVDCDRDGWATPSDFILWLQASGAGCDRVKGGSGGSRSANGDSGGGDGGGGLGLVTCQDVHALFNPGDVSACISVPSSLGSLMYFANDHGLTTARSAATAAAFSDSVAGEKRRPSIDEDSGGGSLEESIFSRTSSSFVRCPATSLSPCSSAPSISLSMLAGEKRSWGIEEEGGGGSLEPTFSRTSSSFARFPATSLSPCSSAPSISLSMLAGEKRSWGIEVKGGGGHSSVSSSINSSPHAASLGSWCSCDSNTASSSDIDILCHLMQLGGEEHENDGGSGEGDSDDDEEKAVDVEVDDEMSGSKVSKYFSDRRTKYFAEKAIPKVNGLLGSMFPGGNNSAAKTITTTTTTTTALLSSTTVAAVASAAKPRRAPQRGAASSHHMPSPHAPLPTPPTLLLPSTPFLSWGLAGSQKKERGAAAPPRSPQIATGEGFTATLLEKRGGGPVLTAEEVAAPAAAAAAAAAAREGQQPLVPLSGRLCSERICERAFAQRLADRPLLAHRFRLVERLAAAQREHSLSEAGAAALDPAVVAEEKAATAAKTATATASTTAASRHGARGNRSNALELKLEEAAAEDPLSMATARLRQRLKQARGNEKRRAFAVMQLSTGLECRLLVLQEVAEESTRRKQEMKNASVVLVAPSPATGLRPPSCPRASGCSSTSSTVAPASSLSASSRSDHVCSAAVESEEKKSASFSPSPYISPTTSPSAGRRRRRRGGGEPEGDVENSQGDQYFTDNLQGESRLARRVSLTKNTAASRSTTTFGRP